MDITPPPRPQEIPRIRLKLFDLKSKSALLGVHELYREYISRITETQSYSDTKSVIDCPICSSSARKFETIVDEISYHRCEKCLSVYTPKMIDKVELNKMYENGVYTNYFQQLVLPGQELRKNVLENRKAKQVDACFEKPGSIMDIACGSGSFLKCCADLGWDVSGIDPSEGAVQVAKQKYGIDIQKGFFTPTTTLDRLYDCISMIGLEHLDQPFLCLQNAVKYLRPGGVLFFEVPSADAFLFEYAKRFPVIPVRYFESGRHYLFFSRQALGFIERENGLESIYIETNGLDIETILLDHFSPDTQEKILNIQEVLNSVGLGDHYRVFMRKKFSV